MRFIELDEYSKIHPGEYLLHKPSSAIVMVGAYVKNDNIIRAFKHGKLFEDKTENFNKIYLDKAEHKEFKRQTCKKCKGSIR